MSDVRLYDILKTPIVSEKSSRQQELHNQYVFEIARGASKIDVKAAVEKLFSVKVESVTVVNIKGKRKTFRFKAGRRNDRRKAYVSLAEGQSIDLGAQV